MQPPAYVSPVKELDPAQAVEAINSLYENVLNWIDYPAYDDLAISPDNENGDERARRTEFFERMSSTKGMLVLMRGVTEFGLEGKRVFAYCHDELHNRKEHPIGIAVVANGKSATYIQEIVSHPGSPGIGGALMERIVQMSEEEGHGGKVLLSPRDDKAKQVFLHWGFMDEQAGRMMLDPAEAKAWVSHDGKWRLQSRIKEKSSDSSPLPGSGTTARRIPRKKVPRL